MGKQKQKEQNHRDRLSAHVNSSGSSSSQTEEFSILIIWFFFLERCPGLDLQLSVSEELATVPFLETSLFFFYWYELPEARVQEYQLQNHVKGSSSATIGWEHTFSLLHINEWQGALEANDFKDHVRSPKQPTF